MYLEIDQIRLLIELNVTAACVRRNYKISRLYWKSKGIIVKSDLRFDGRNIEIAERARRQSVLFVLELLLVLRVLFVCRSRLVLQTFTALLF